MPMDNHQYPLQIVYIMLWMIFKILEELILLLLNILLWIRLLWGVQVNRLLWMFLTKLQSTIWSLVHQLTKLLNKETGQPVETTDNDPQERNIGQQLRYPIQETQEPGIHPSNSFIDTIRKMREYKMILDQEVATEQAISRREPFIQGQRQGREHCEVEEEQDAGDETPKEAEGAQDSSQVLDHKSEIKEGKKPPEAGTSLKKSSIPEDVESSYDPIATQPEATAEIQTVLSDEGPSATGNTANKKRKKKRRRKTAEDKQASYEDPQASTDESHHISIETFSSGYHVPAQSKDQAACKGKGKRKENKGE